MTRFVMVDDAGELKDAIAALLLAAGIPVTNGTHLPDPSGTAERIAVLESAASEQELVAAVRQATIGLRRAAALDAPTPSAGTPLSPREREVLELAARGLTADGVAVELILSVETVRTHTRNAIKKLGARNRLHAVVIALRAGVISLPKA
ncbi:MAG: helix-turn-helix transcriptional regulator [Baekduia sp.]